MFEVASSPGKRNAIEMRSKRPGFSSTTTFVGPRHTESASTIGMIDATTVIAQSTSKSSMNQ